MLDKKDRALLNCLQKDCTKCLHELAENIGLTPNPCWKRIKRLEDEGYINGRVALLNKEKLGFKLTAFVMIQTENHNHDWYEFFVEKINSLPEVVGFYRTNGEYDYFLHVLVSDIKGYDDFYNKLIKMVNGITNVTSCFAMEQIKCVTQIPLV
jgi:Lrp/AsnC family transcriptional regulator